MDNSILKHLVKRMLDAHALTLRDIENGEEPFLYSSGNRGPGYVMVKGLVSQRSLLKHLVQELALHVLEAFPEIEYVSGNATGGMVPAWILAETLSEVSGREIPYFYVRGTRKQGGHGEQITGDKNNDFFIPGRKGIVMEELVNFAQTIANSVLVQREAGYDVRHGATILNYDHAASRTLLAQTGVTLIALFTVEQLLAIAETVGAEKRLVDDYRAFLSNPKGWQEKRGLTLPAS